MSVTMNFVHDIAAPPERVYAAMTDHSTWDHWMKGLVRIEPLTEGPLGAGSKWREVRKMMGQEASEVFEVKAADPGKRLELYVDGKQGSSKKGEYHFVYTLTPTAQGTQLEIDGEISMGGGFADLMSKLFLGVMKKAMSDDHVAMKKYIESSVSIAS